MVQGTCLIVNFAHFGTTIRFHFWSTMRFHFGSIIRGLSKYQSFRFGATMRFHFGTMRFHFGTMRFHFGTTMRFHFGTTKRPFWHYALPFWEHCAWITTSYQSLAAHMAPHGLWNFMTDKFLLNELTTVTAANKYNYIYKLNLHNQQIQICDIHKYNDMHRKSRGLKWARWRGHFMPWATIPDPLPKVVPRSSHSRPLVLEGMLYLEYPQLDW